MTMSKHTKEAIGPGKDYGIHHNWVGFPDEIMSDMTTKETLSHWTDSILSSISYALKKYHFKTRNVDYGDKQFAVDRFREAAEQEKHVVPVLEDFVVREISGMEDILIAMTGVASDEVYMYRCYKKLLARIKEWDTDYMWSDDCNGDTRLCAILRDWCGFRPWKP